MKETGDDLDVSTCQLLVSRPKVYSLVSHRVVLTREEVY